MNSTKKIIAVLLCLILTLSAVFVNTAAAEVEVAGLYAEDAELTELSAKTGLVPISALPINEDLTPTSDELPSRYNSADMGLVLPVREQQAQTCWAFGALSTLETLLLKSGEDVNTFAPQHANFWGTKRTDGSGWQRNEYSAGYSYIPLGYLTSGEGPVYESQFPEYSDREFYNTYTASPDYMLTDVIYFNNKTDRDVIKEFIYTYGSVVGNFNADANFISQGNAYYCSDHSFKTQELVGHCVSVVGWDDSFAKENFQESLSGMPDNDGAWLIKNSWGDQNGDNGYYWISYEDVWVFDQKFAYSYAFTGYKALSEDVKVYQNETDGATYEFTYLTTPKKQTYYDTITYMNVFDFEEENRTLDRVVFETTSMDADYKIYYIPMKNDKPTNDTSLWTELYTGVVDYTGYICADFDNVEIPAGKGAIGVQIDNKRTYLENKDTYGYTYIANSIGVDEWLTSSGKLIFRPQSDYGMSYYMQNGKVRDVMDFYENDYDDNIGGTFVIKAITDNSKGEPLPDSTPDNIDPTEPETTAPTEPESTAPTEPESTAPTEPESSADQTEPSETTPTETSPDEPVFEYLLGDADLNGKVNVKDATLIQKHVAGLEEITSYALLAAETDLNGRISVVDATNVQKFAAGIAIPHKIGELFKIFK